ncbi:hypothetical protein ID866_3773 [Astraeus odoratus]|nr:hypothetical protein ID866_3773 [Astraeus odoratus]
MDDVLPANPIVKHLVDELMVECPQQPAGCTHTCQRQLLASHLEQTCQYVSVPCPVDDCDQSTLRKDYDKHADVCVHRSAECQDCGITVKYGNLNAHYSECSSKVTTCSLCKAELSRSETQQHHAICPDVEVPCLHVDNGCPWTGCRRDLRDVHVPTCPYEAIKGFFATNNAKISTLITENATLKQKVRALEGFIQTMQRDMLFVKSALSPWYRFEMQRLDQASTNRSFSSTNNTDSNRPLVATSASHDTTNRTQELSMTSPIDAVPLVHPADVNDAAAYFSAGADPGYLEGDHVTSGALRSFGGMVNAPVRQHQRSFLFPVAPLNLSTSLEGTLSGLRESLATVSASVDSLARWNDITLTTESMRINEELGSLRYAIHGIRVQLHRLMMDRNAQALGRPDESPLVTGPASTMLAAHALPGHPPLHPPMTMPMFSGPPGTKL